MTLCKFIRLTLEIVSFTFSQNANAHGNDTVVPLYPFLQKRVVLHKKN